MFSLRETLTNLVQNLSEGNHDGSLAQYRSWLDIGVAHGHINNDKVGSDARRIPQPNNGASLIHPTVHLFVLFIGESPSIPVRFR